MRTIATLHALRRHLGLAATDTADDPALIHALETASALLEMETARTFTPRTTAISHLLKKASQQLSLLDDLLTLTSITNEGVTVPLASVERLPVQGASSVLRLKDGLTFSAGAVLVTGVWGYHPDLTMLWRVSGDVVAGGTLSISAPLVTVNDADGADGAQETPRFQAGQLLQIESEVLRVLKVDVIANTLTVLRGQAGTSAASHAANQPISVFQPSRAAADTVVRWAAWLYRNPAAPLPDDLRLLVRPLRRDRVDV